MQRERPALRALGRRVAELRRAAGLSQAGLARCAELHRATVWRIERGERRTRRSTLERIVAALGEPAEVVDDLVAAAGDALAPESQHADRVDRRRARRGRA